MMKSLLLHVDADVVVGLLAQLDVYLLAGGGGGDFIYLACENLEAIALGDDFHLIVGVVYLRDADVGAPLRVVPSHLRDEQLQEVGFLYVSVEFFSGHYFNVKC